MQTLGDSPARREAASGWAVGIADWQFLCALRIPHNNVYKKIPLFRVIFFYRRWGIRTRDPLGVNEVL